mgnify:CR=1 FL=1
MITSFALYIKRPQSLTVYQKTAAFNIAFWKKSVKFMTVSILTVCSHGNTDFSAFAVGVLCASAGDPRFARMTEEGVGFRVHGY